MTTPSWRSKLQHYLNKFEYEKSLRLVPFLVASLAAAGTAIIYSKVFFQAEEGALWLINNTHWSLSLTATLLTIFLSWFIPYRIARQAGGSGIPQMLIANELDPAKDKSLIRSLIGIRVIATKILASLICVLGGGAVGQEGPTLQIASGIFYRIGEKSTHWIQQISSRTFILAGGASGLAAAFNTPLGGIAYALEELSKDTFNNFKTYVLWSVITTGILVQTFMGGYLYLGFPTLESVSITTYINVIGISLLAGAIGSYFGSILYGIAEFRKKFTGAKQLIALNLACGFLFWLGIYFLSRTGVGGGKLLILDLLFNGQWATPSDILVRIAGPLLMSLAGVAGGLFAPSLAIGAAMGSLFSQIFWPHNHHLLIMAGMIAFLTGFMRTPFTAFILIFEMTDRHSALFPMMISAAVAAGISRSFQKHSFYDRIKDDFLDARKINSPESGSPPPT
ncbi:chloride channel protein [Bdellovibrio svalbardensis]|uniref:Chloride channel protein n=1 Tax=Bdellovibrio svalbardensis TaxID=2972972 RepID=A0ABT6DMX9_9BACT|nr:chloride channel protein [Bdellovibrio svalbardensis]MDG0818234.1 chloride channel protein [Bdellovibrio svalbardensis]